MENSGCEKLLGVKLDWKLNFDDHISDICKKARGKLNALVRIVPFIGLSKRRVLMNAFFNSQFSYCPIIWMFHSCINKQVSREYALVLFTMINSHSFQNY